MSTWHPKLMFSSQSRKWIDWGSLVVVAGVLLWPAWRTGAWPGTGVDLYGTVWFYGWIRHSIEHVVDPSFTDLFFYPNGKDIFAHTGNNFVDAYLSVPFQWCFGDHFVAPFMTLLLLGNVWALRVWLSELGCRHFELWLFGLLWLLNPYCLSELAMGRPTQLLMMPTFLALTFWNRMLNGEDVWKGLGSIVALQGWCYWFYGFFLVQLLCAHGLLVVLRKPTRVLNIWKPLSKSVLLTLVLVSPAVLSMLHVVNGQDVPGLTDLNSTDPQQIRNALAPWIRGYQVVDPIGHPIFQSTLYGSVAILGLLLSLQSRIWFVVAVVMMGVALGPFQTAGEHEWLNIPYLWMVYWLPFFERLWFPYRALGFVMVALLTQLALVSKEWKWSRLQQFSLGGFVLIAGAFDLWHVDSLPLVHTTLPKSDVQDCIDAPTIQLPNGFVHPTMTWQVDNPQPFFGGMGENGLLFLPKGYKGRLQNPFVQYLRSASLIVNTSKTYSPFDKARIVELGFRYVLWDRGMTEMERQKRLTSDTERPTEVFDIQQNLMEQLGQPVCWDAQWLLFDLWSPSFANDRDATLFEWQWPQPTLSNYEQRLRELGRVPKP